MSCAWRIIGTLYPLSLSFLLEVISEARISVVAGGAAVYPVLAERCGAGKMVYHILCHMVDDAIGRDGLCLAPVGNRLDRTDAFGLVRQWEYHKDRALLGVYVRAAAFAALGYRIGFSLRGVQRCG